MDVEKAAEARIIKFILEKFSWIFSLHVQVTGLNIFPEFDWLQIVSMHCLEIKDRAF